jgi:hypothetical protein
MSTAVLEIAEAITEKAQKLTPQEWDELMEMLEDIEDNAAAEKAKADGKFTPLEVAEKEIRNAWDNRLNRR